MTDLFDSDNPYCRGSIGAASRGAQAIALGCERGISIWSSRTSTIRACRNRPADQCAGIGAPSPFTVT